MSKGKRQAEQYGEVSKQQKNNNGGWDPGQGRSSREVVEANRKRLKCWTFIPYAKVTSFHLNFSISMLSHNIFVIFYFLLFWCIWREKSTEEPCV